MNMTEAMTHHHEHASADFADDGALALHAEDLYLRLARRPHHYQAGHEHALHESTPPYDIEALKQRLGSAAPQLTDAQEQSVAAGFAHHFPTLPRTEDHHHHGHDDGCGKRHGPIRRTLERMEHGVLSRVRSQRAKIAVALMFRAGFFTMCPGDDIAAIGLQVYSSVSGHQQEHHHEEHAEVNAVLPARPRIEFKHGKAVVQLPLERDPLPHMPPNTAVTPAPKKTTAGFRPAQPMHNAVSEAKGTTSEKAVKSRRHRWAALGMLAMAAFGGFSADASHDRREAPASIAAEAPSSPYRIELPPLATQPSNDIELPPLTVQRPKPAILQQHIVTGDSQWAMAEQAVRATGEAVTPSRSQVVADYIAKLNKQTNPNPNHIRAGQTLKVPNAAQTLRLLATLHR